MPSSLPPARRRRLALLVVVVGLAVASAPWLDHGADERRIQLDLSHPETLRSLEISWLEDGEPFRRSAYSYPAGDAPRQVQQTMTLRDGSYQLQLVVDRGAGARHIDRQIEVARGVDEIRIPVP